MWRFFSPTPSTLMVATGRSSQTFEVSVMSPLQGVPPQFGAAVPETCADAVSAPLEQRERPGFEQRPGAPATAAAPRPDEQHAGDADGDRHGVLTKGGHGSGRGVERAPA